MESTIEINAYTAVSKISWRPDFDALEGVDGCLVWGFLGLSRVGLK